MANCTILKNGLHVILFLMIFEMNYKLNKKNQERGKKYQVKVGNGLRKMFGKP